MSAVIAVGSKSNHAADSDKLPTGGRDQLRKAAHESGSATGSCESSYNVGPRAGPNRELLIESRRSLGHF